MTDRFAIFGRPLGHSKSPLIYQTFARQAGIDLDYQKIETDDAGFEAAFEALRNSGGRGGNVTAPFKLRAFALATQRMPRAQMAGATNCFRFEKDEILVENFDGLGLVEDIERNLKMPIAGKSILLLGAGGAVRGALLPLLERKPGRLVLSNRTHEKAVELAQAFAAYGDVEPASSAALGAASFDMVLNATSASLSGLCPEVQSQVFRQGTLAYELAYGKGMTPFLKLANSRGAYLADGVGLLVEQAAEAFNWWYGIRPDTRMLIDELTVPFKQ